MKTSLQMTNHEIGCMFESYVEVLEFRGFIKEAEQLSELASKLK